MIFLTLNVGLPFLRAAWAKKRASTWMLRCGLHVLRSKSGITIWQWPYSGTVRIKRDRVYLLQVTTSAQCCHLMKGPDAGKLWTLLINQCLYHFW